jgi:hypothetical protein
MIVKPLVCAALLMALGSTVADAQPARGTSERTRSAQRESRRASPVPQSLPAQVEVPTTSPVNSAALCEADEIKSCAREVSLDDKDEIAAGYALEKPAPSYDFDGSNLTWRQPAENDTHYLLVTLQDTISSHTLPGCKVLATVTDGTGKDAVSSVTLAEMWDKRFRHYGLNLALPPAMTTGTLTLSFDPPGWKRRGRNEGTFMVKPVSFKFTNVDFTTATLTGFETLPAPKPDEKIVWPKGRRPFLDPTPYPGSQKP